MKNYNAFSKGFTEFILQNEQQQQIRKILYRKWFSYDVDLETQQGNSKIKMQGFWKNNMVQFDGNNQPLRTIKSTWDGFVIEEGNQEVYFLTWKGFWNARLILKDRGDIEWIVFRPQFNWKKFSSDLQIEIMEDHESFDAAFLLTLVHCVNYHMAVSLN